MPRFKPILKTTSKQYSAFSFSSVTYLDVYLYVRLSIDIKVPCRAVEVCILFYADLYGCHFIEFVVASSIAKGFPSFPVDI